MSHHPAPEAVSAALARLSAAEGWASYGFGRPEPDTAEWARADAYLEAGAIEAAVDRLIASSYAELPQPRAVVGNYVFRDVAHYPLTIAGYLFAAEQWVPTLSGNVAVHTAAPARARLLEPRLAVLPGDPLGGQPGVSVTASLAALAEQLAHEVRGLVSPLIDAFRTPRYVAPANGWASALDSLASGFLAAGRGGLGMDAAWLLWAEAIADRPFPTRRRPRRLAYEVDGEELETSVGAGCCLWFVTDEAKARADQRYCATCYLETDATRIELLAKYRREQLATGRGPRLGMDMRSR